jgi:hypothetical protein
LNYSGTESLRPQLEAIGTTSTACKVFRVAH